MQTTISFQLNIISTISYDTIIYFPSTVPAAKKIENNETFDEFVKMFEAAEKENKA